MKGMAVHDPTPDERNEEILQYRFRNQILIGWNAVKRIAKEGESLGVNLSWKEGDPLVSSLRHPDEQTMAELMVVMGDLLRPESDLYYERVVEFVRKRVLGQQLEEVLRRFENAVNRVNRGGMNFTVDGQALTPREAYLRILTSILEADDTKALKEEQKLAGNPPLRDLLWFSGYSYCLEMHRALFWLSSIFLKQRLLPKEALRTELCIYCASADGTFTTREHTLPESLGNSHSILPRGWVCDDCQSAFSAIEGEVLKMAPFAVTRILATRYTKEGRFPSCRFSKVHIRKTRPNRLVVEVYGGKRTIIHSDEPNGVSSLKLRDLGGRFDHIKVARMLIKGALGAIALERGRKEVLASKYDVARRFALYGKPFAGRLVLPAKTGPPQRIMRIKWWDDLPTALINIHGVEMLVSLTPHELPDLPDGFEHSAKVFELDQH